MSRLAWIALSAATVALVAGVTAAALILASPAKKTPTNAVTVSGAPTSFELPLAESPSALAVAKHRGDLLVGIAARPGGPVEIAALRAETALPARSLEVRLDDRRLAPKPCGTGCARADVQVLEGSPKRLTIRSGTRSVTFELPARLPPIGARVFAWALRTMDRLRSFRFSEELSSGREALLTNIDVEAPDRVRLSSSNGFRSVIIGRNRWDYHDGRWERGPFPGLKLSQMLMWHEAKHARIVGRRGRLTELAAFGLEPVPAWFDLTVEPSGRVVEAEMISPSHFMVHRYKDFNGSVSITPPGRK